MKIINEKGKLFGLINIIDLGVLLIILALAAGGIWYMNRNKASTVLETKEYLITIKCSGFDQDVVQAINIGDRLYYGQKGPQGLTNIEITDVRTEPAKMDVYTADGRILVQQHPELVDIYATVRIHDPVDDDPMLYIGSLHANVGKDVTLKTTKVEIPGKIVSVQEE